MPKNFPRTRRSRSSVSRTNRGQASRTLVLRNRIALIRSGRTYPANAVRTFSDDFAPRRRILYNRAAMRLAIDTGGTFTDCVFARGGELRILKVLSTPENPARAIAEALAKIGRDAEIAADAALELTCGTTVGTNALLERRGGRVALVTTAGFEDVLEIGRQARPKLYDFFVDKAEPLVGARERIGARERLAWDGSVVTELTTREISRVVGAVGRARPEAVAICFLFSFRNSRHEARVAEALRRAGY